MKCDECAAIPGVLKTRENVVKCCILLRVISSNRTRYLVEREDGDELKCCTRNERTAKRTLIAYVILSRCVVGELRMLHF